MYRKPGLLFFLVFAALFATKSYAQNIVLTGEVKDKVTKEVLPFVHVFFKKTQVGTTTDFDGLFRLEVEGKIPSDTLVFQCLGYKTQRFAVSSKRTFAVEMEMDRIMVQEIVVHAGENPAFIIMDRIVKQKAVNNPKSFDRYTCNEYSKIRFDLNNFTEKTKQGILLRPFGYIWDNSDTTPDGVPYLPVLLVEKTFTHLYQKDPKKEHSILEAKKVTGLPGRKILEFVEDLYFTPNVYENYVVILDRNFPSPLNDNYKQHYHYFLDSSGTGNEKEYHLAFQPKYKRDLGFTGEMSVDADSYALKSISLRFDILANVNFVRSYLVTQKYGELERGQTVLTETNVLGDFTVLENQTDLTGFFGRKKSVFTNYKINEPIEVDTIKSKSLIIETADATTKTNEYWDVRRPDSLDQKEQAIGEMVDRLENDPQFILRKNFFVSMFTGYTPAGKFDVGDFYTFYSYNFIEHSRLKFAMRTSKRWDVPFSGDAYIAYGFNDVRWKFGLRTQVDLGPKKKTAIGFGISSDIEELGRSFNAMPIDHLFTSLFIIGSVSSRVYANKWNAYVDQRLATGLVARINYFYRGLSPTDTVNFRYMPEPGITTYIDEYRATGFEFSMKYSWQNKDLNGAFYNKEDQKKEFRKIPDLRFLYSVSTDALEANVNYQKVKFAASQFFRTKSLGFFKYYVEAGKTFGTAPYPFLDIPFGNQLLFADDFAFNLMKYVEFISDEYVMVNLQHHFDGAILDRIPLINLLKWRSFVFAKGYWGSLSDENKNSKYVLPDYVSPINEPYVEVGFGLENIFKFARMDFVWRINDTTLPDTYKFIVKPSFVFAF